MLTRLLRSGEAYYQSVFHKGRSLCCADVARPGSCAFALHNASASLVSAARAGLQEGRTCVTYAFLMDYGAILAQMRQMTSPADGDAAPLPARLVTAAGVHSMKAHDAAFFKAEVAAFLDELATPRWKPTVVAMHTIAAPNYTSIAAAGHKQTPETVAAFTAALRDAVASVAASAGVAAAPRLVDLHEVTSERGGGERALHARRRFPRLDALHFRDAFYQTAFVADALALDAARRTRDAAA